MVQDEPAAPPGGPTPPGGQAPPGGPVPPSGPSPPTLGRPPAAADGWPVPAGGWPGVPPPSAGVRRPTLWIVLTAIALAVVCMSATAVGVVAAIRAYHHSHQQPSAVLGQPARDGEFLFTADKVTCGLKQVGPPDDYLTPTGEFCVVQLNIRNVGTGPALFADALQQAYAPNGDRYATDSAAGLYANPDPTIFFNDINPGIDVKAMVVYDIPAGGKIAKLELHESPGSRGVMIKVR